MRCLHDQIELSSSAPLQLIDITGRLRERVTSAGLRDGVVTVLSRHTTARVNLNEREERLQQDMVAFLRRMAPADGDYGHNLDTVDGRPNAHAHLLGLFVNASESIPVRNGELVLGEWQSLFFVELDGPRSSRQVFLQMLGSFEDLQAAEA